ncbi:MAG: GldG family protein [Anaerolineae bacterium]
MVAQLRDRAPQLVMVGVVALAIGTAAQMLGSDPVWLPQVFWAIGIALMLSYALLRPAELRAALTGRQARYGGNALVASLAFIGILGFVNYLGAQYHRRFDLTGTGQYSLSQQTKQILAVLEEPIQVTAFMAPDGPQAERVRNLLDEYKYVSDKIDYRFVDPDRQPALARQYGITSYGQLVFEQGDRRQETFGLDEQDVTSSILKVSETEPRKVYFTTGHQERSPEDAGGNGYLQIKTALERDNYEVELLNLQTITDTLPSDVDAIIVAGPQVRFAAEETQRLEEYVASGGKLMVLADPGVDTGLGSLLSQMGLQLDDDIVVDPAQSFFGDAGTPLVTSFRFHTITKDLGGLTVFFPLARSVSRIDNTSESVSVTEVIQSSSRSWGEMNLQQRPAQPDAGDPRGPLTMAAVATGPEGSRVAVFGDSDLVSNSVLTQVRGSFGNPDLFRNTVNWLTESEDLIAIGPKPPDNRQIRPLTGGQQNLLLITLAGLLPLGILLAGGLVWWNRR